MRWRAERPPKTDEKREKVLFAWLPIRCGDEWVWLEKVVLTRKWCRVNEFGGDWVSIGARRLKP